MSQHYINYGYFYVVDGDYNGNLGTDQYESVNSDLCWVNHLHGKSSVLSFLRMELNVRKINLTWGAKKVCEFVDEIFTIGDMVTPETYNNNCLLY